MSRPRLAAALTALLALAPAAPSAAQSTVHIVYEDESQCPPFGSTTLCTRTMLLTATIDGVAGRIDEVRPLPRASQFDHLYVTPDGAVLVWAGYSDVTGYTMYVHDRRSAVTQALPLADRPYALIGNPVTPEVYLLHSTGIVGLSAAGRRVVSPRQCAAADHPSVSADGRRLAYDCVRPLPAAPFIVVVDLDSGQEVAVPSHYGPSLNRDGTEVTGTASGSAALQRIDVASGAVLATGPPALDVLSDDAFGPVVAYRSNVLQLLDRATLAPVWSGIFPNDVPSWPVLDGRNHLLYSYGNTPSGAGFSVFDLDARRVRLHAAVRARSHMAFAVAPPPPAAPVLQSPFVSGGAVQLSWAPGGPQAAVQRYVVEAGSGPGRRDIVAGLDVGLQTSLAANGVPPGRYFIRVRAANFNGLGSASNEIVVTVP